MTFIKQSDFLRYALITVLALLSFQTNLNAQSFKWARKMGNVGDDRAEAIAVDSNGNVYTTGNFTGTVDFNPGTAVFNLTSYGVNDIFISKLDSMGNFLWAKQIGGATNDFAYAIAVDDSQNVYTTGYFTTTADFNPGAVSFNLISSGGTDIFVSKLDASGNFVYAKQIGSTADDIGYAITVDDSSRVFTAGYFGGTADFDPGTGVYNMTPVSSGDWDIFVSKLDGAGNFSFAKQFGGNSSDWATTIALDKSGNIYTTGSFGTTADFDPGPATYYLSSVFSNGIFVSKLDPQGNFVWAKGMGGPGVDIGDGLVIGDSNQVYITGFFQLTADFDPGTGIYNMTSNGGSDIFISKLDSMGNFKWAKQIGGTNAEWGASIALDKDQNVYTTGSFVGTIDFDPGAGVHNLVSSFSDMFISKLSASGNYGWAGRVGGTGNEYGMCIAANKKGNVYITGSFEATSDFDPGTGTYNLSANGNGDVYVMKMGPCTTSSSINPAACYSYTSPSGNHTWAVSGTYTDTMANTAGCDSIITIHLTIHNATTAALSTSACNSYTSPSGNHLWTNSGIYMDTLINMAGCDSIININLVITNSTASSLTTSACYSYLSPSGNHLWTSSGTYMDTLTNAAGCDSIITIHLTIHNTSGSLSVSACNSYTSPSGNHVWTGSGTYLDTMTNSFGCDSLITIQLSVHSNTSGSLSVSACNSYTSPSGTHVWTVSGSYLDTMANMFGCDSLITIQLSVHSNTLGSLSVSACNSYTSPSGQHVWTANGTYIDTMANVFGCDSILTINLTIHTVDVTVSNNSPVLQSNATGAGYHWLDCNNGMSPISGETNQSFTPINNGSYAVQVTQNGCTDTSACISVTNVGISHINVEKPALYPNPTHGNLTIALPAYHQVEIRVSDILGQEVLSVIRNVSNQLQLHIPGKSGVYFMKLTVEGGLHYYYKIVKE